MNKSYAILNGDIIVAAASIPQESSPAVAFQTDSFVELDDAQYAAAQSAPDGYAPVWIGNSVSYRKISIPIEDLRLQRRAKLEEDCPRFIESKPDGSTRYHQRKQTTMNVIFSVCQAKLADPATPELEKPYFQARMEKLLRVNAWVSSVLDYYYQVDAQLAAAQTVGELEAISWDFTPLEATDPNITLEEVRL